MKAVEAEHPPLHLLLGASTLPRVKAKVEALEKDVAAWEATTLGADFPEGRVRLRCRQGWKAGTRIEGFG